MNLGKYTGKVKTKGVPTYTIYMIDCLNSVYVGKTKSFRKRINKHISDCHNTEAERYNIPLYKHIRALEEKSEFKFDESCFQIIEEIKDYEDEDDILYCEKGWIEFYKWFDFKMLNVLKPIRTEEERIEQQKKYDKKYYEENKEKVLEKAKEYREENREEINRKQRERRAKEKLEKQNIIINK